ncbi:MAG: YfiM family protein [Saprospiraceae bacterium]|nr:YfiM family protein [Saprospiraceae bacterium]
MKHLKFILSFLLIIVISSNLFSQNISDSNQVNKKLLTGVIVFESVSTASTLGGLYVLWYSDYPQSSFHFFNDNKEWLQMDKIGHAAVGYYVGKIGYEFLRWPGVEKKKAIWYGGTVGLAYMTTIEILDGFSAEWGASLGDVAANTFGAGMFIGQQLAWDEQRVLLKWSFHKSQYAKYRPNVLGSNFQERMLKDYNGQTYWLSANIHSFLPDDSKFPKWLNVAFGYSADGMLGGNSNPTTLDGNPLPYFKRNRQYFLSLDLDLTRIETKSKALNMVFDIVGVIKFPFPALEYNSKNEWKMHGVYF